MAVFVAASDETSGGSSRGVFFHGGFVMSVSDWENWFTPSWAEHVLDRKPAIPYLHMVDIRSETWREEYGLDIIEAEYRVDEAARVIGNTGCLHLVTSEMDQGHFFDQFGRTKIVKPTGQPGTFQFQPDYLAFLGFAFTVLRYVLAEHPEAEKVDFMVERKQGVTQNLEPFWDTAAEHFMALGKPEMARLVGDLIPVGKDRAPVQAADVACWHIRRMATQTMSRTDARRYRKIGSRFGTRHTWSHDDIAGLARRSRLQVVPSPFPPKPKRKAG